MRRLVRSLLTAMRVLPKGAASPDYLRRHVDRSWKKESRLLQSFGLADGMSILDLGCGPGHFSGRLAEWLPRARITALDSNPAMLDAARSEYGSVEFVKGSADATRLSGEAFDFVIARFLFQHLPDPVAVAKEALRILRPGGKLVIIDIDDDLFGVVEPHVPGFRRLLARYGAAQSQRGGNRRVGRSLPRILREAGFKDLQIECVAIHSDESGLAECFPQLDPAPLRSLVTSGRLSQEEYAEYRGAHDDFIAAADPYALVLLFAACGVKSAHPS
jgi:ubiquinone/menaquinone biosynthesis C-methylase UbiE